MRFFNLGIRKISITEKNVRSSMINNTVQQIS